MDLGFGTSSANPTNGPTSSFTSNNSRSKPYVSPYKSYQPAYQYGQDFVMTSEDDQLTAAIIASLTSADVADKLLPLMKSQPSSGADMSGIECMRSEKLSQRRESREFNPVLTIYQTSQPPIVSSRSEAPSLSQLANPPKAHTEASAVVPFPTTNHHIPCPLSVWRNKLDWSQTSSARHTTMTCATSM